MADLLLSVAITLTLWAVATGLVRAGGEVLRRARARYRRPPAIIREKVTLRPRAGGRVIRPSVPAWKTPRPSSPPSSNGRTPDFESGYGGSNPPGGRVDG